MDMRGMFERYGENPQHIFIVAQKQREWAAPRYARASSQRLWPNFPSETSKALRWRKALEIGRDRVPVV